jgi:uncharacterized protein (TIGR02757 family)
MKNVEMQLNRWYEEYHKPRFLGIDPLCSVRKLQSKEDREVAALIASVISYGRVEIIIKNCEYLFTAMEWQPAEYIRTATVSDMRKRVGEFRHRFNSASDIVLLFQVLKKILKHYGTIEAFFIDNRAIGEEPLRDSITSFSSRVKKMASSFVFKGDSRGFDYLFPSPESGSACKRLNMFLRWVVRVDDQIDLGIWSKVKPSQLIIPVDTHVAEQSRKLGLTSRNAADWKMAEEITSVLRVFDPQDPVRYDFSLCRAGMVSKVA